LCRGAYRSQYRQWFRRSLRCDADQPALYRVILKNLATLSPGVVRGMAAAITIPYLTATLLSSRLPPLATWIAAVVVLLALGFGWLRAGRPPSGAWAAAIGLPLHLALLPSGGLSSPLLPLLIPWFLLLTWLWPFLRLVALGIAVFTWMAIVQFWTGGIGAGMLLEAGLVIMAGVLPAWALDRMRQHTLTQAPDLGRILGEMESQVPPGVGTETSRRIEELAATLDRTRRTLGGWRAVLWEIDSEADRAYPRLVSGGAMPPTVSLTGDPMRLARDDSLILRLETPPRWAAGSTRACIIPIDKPDEYDALLTVEYRGEGLFPTAQTLEMTAAQLSAFLDMQREAARASATRAHFSAIIKLLRELPDTLQPTEFAALLARAAREFTGMTGAAVARWDQDVGHLLALDGDDGGAPVGSAFTGLESEMAFAAGRATTLVRQRERGERRILPVIAPGERWHSEPRTIIVVPLYSVSSGVVGVLALWSTDPVRADPDQIEVIETMAPYAAMQLQHIQAYGPLRQLADHDPLTGLSNRRVFDERIEREEEHFLRYRRPASLLILDVDHFKRINDTFSHEAGDAVLKALAHLLRTTVRGTDLAARFGGEEFVVLLPETPLAGALEIAERLRRQVETMIVEWQNTPIEVRISIGVAACPECAATPGALLPAADAALYTSKNNGRNRVTAAPYAVFHGDNG
jgi:diguanylate cyclase (GGDEF)-like protein